MPLPAYPTPDASAPTPLGPDAGSSSAPATDAPATPSSTPERKPVGSTIEFDTFDVVTGQPLRGFGIVRGYVEDVDAVMDRAARLGATVKRPAQDQVYGDRDGFIVDPFGHGWTIGSHVDDVAPDEIMRRMSEFAEAG